jgi:large subunit ribosomal protein L31e
MAKAKIEKTEKTYNVPLRKGFQKAPRYRKAKKAVTTLKEFIVRHMKCEPKNVRIGKVLNAALWERGIKNPPHHVKITVVKEDDGRVKAELFGYKYEEPKIEESKAKQDVKDLEKELDKAVKPAEIKEKPKAETKPKEAKAEEKTKAEAKPKAETKPKEAKAEEKTKADKPKKETKPK